MTLNIKVGDTIPEGTFLYVPYEPKLDDGVSYDRYLIHSYTD